MFKFNEFCTYVVYMMQICDSYCTYFSECVGYKRQTNMSTTKLSRKEILSKISVSLFKFRMLFVTLVNTMD